MEARKLCPSERGFSFDAGGRTFRLVVSHSMSGTLMPVFESFFNISLLLLSFFLLEHLRN